MSFLGGLAVDQTGIWAAYTLGSFGAGMAGLLLTIAPIARQESPAG